MRQRIATSAYYQYDRFKENRRFSTPSSIEAKSEQAELLERTAPPVCPHEDEFYGIGCISSNPQL
jgi:hypothetical protein